MSKSKDGGELWPDNPHSVPHIPCSKCGTEHHIDATLGKYQGHCRECSAFLRRPTFEEQKEFSNFIVWNTKKMEEEDGVKND